MIKVRSIFRSLKYAFAGLLHVIKTQNNARFHLIATMFVLIISAWLNLTLIQWGFILIAISVVWITECFNTSIEELFNLIHPDSPLIVKNGKDSGAAAVLVAAILSVFLGALVLVPALIQKIHTLY